MLCNNFTSLSHVAFILHPISLNRTNACCWWLASSNPLHNTLVILSNGTLIKFPWIKFCNLMRISTIDSTLLQSVIDNDPQNQPFSQFRIQFSVEPWSHDLLLRNARDNHSSNDDELVSLKNHLLIKHTRWIVMSMETSWMEGLRKWNEFYGNVVVRNDSRWKFPVWIPNERRIEKGENSYWMISGWFQLEICRTSLFLSLLLLFYSWIFAAMFIPILGWERFLEWEIICW